ncbi:MAG: hypothetical protein EOP04_16875 [Proteobacteria bacterium]|nr:MAG: hypothetical protein EOP04_16875 [Pseudomonadota bacterium]
MNQIDNEGQFPEGYEHVRERLDETTQHLKQIDEQIKNIPKDQGPTLKYNPPNFVGRVIPGSRARSIAALEAKQSQIKADTLAKTEADTRNGDNRSGRVIRDTVRETLYPNPYRTLTKEERREEKSTIKEIEQSQDYMDAELVARAAERKTAQKETVSKPEDKGKESLSMSARFSLSLGYTKASEKSDRPPTPTRDRVPDKDRD